MKIAILSKADQAGGGASRMAETLSRLLQAKGHTAHHYLGASQTNSIYYRPRSLYGSFFLGKFVRRLNWLIKVLGFPELIPWELFFLRLKNIKGYDLIHFHDLSSAISPFTVRYLARELPTIWTFHDCSPFTGGCLQPRTCERFKTRCGPCPQLGLWPIDSKFDFTGFMQDIKRKTAREENFVAVAPSRWMANMAMKSGMFSTPPLLLPNGVDATLFRPLDKATIRQKLGLPTGRPLVLVFAAYIWNELKGVNYVLAALNRLKQLNPYVLIIGQLDASLEQQFAAFDHYKTGYIRDDRVKAEYLAAADLFLFCSLADNMPLVILETMAVATPTVGFATGGVPEMVEHLKSGYLVPQGDVDGLVRGLQTGLSDKQAALWGQAARQRVEKSFSYEVFLKNHLDLYEAILKKFNQ